MIPPLPRAFLLLKGRTLVIIGVLLGFGCCLLLGMNLSLPRSPDAAVGGGFGTWDFCEIGVGERTGQAKHWHHCTPR